MRIYHVVRGTFFLGVMAMIVGAIGIGILAITDMLNPHLASRTAVLLLLGGFTGVLTSIALASSVRCRSCNKKAMVFPETDPSGPVAENLYQPWRRKCGNCGTTIDS
jgi:hypothetical protein